jgi:hypothetical protein
MSTEAEWRECMAIQGSDTVRVVVSKRVRGHSREREVVREASPVVVCDSPVEGTKETAQQLAEVQEELKPILEERKAPRVSFHEEPQIIEPPTTATQKAELKEMVRELRDARREFKQATEPSVDMKDQIKEMARDVKEARKELRREMKGHKKERKMWKRHHLKDLTNNGSGDSDDAFFNEPNQTTSDSTEEVAPVPPHWEFPAVPTVFEEPTPVESQPPQQNNEGVRGWFAKALQTATNILPTTVAPPAIAPRKMSEECAMLLSVFPALDEDTAKCILAKHRGDVRKAINSLLS